MEYLFLWLLFSLLVGALGAGRKIGFGAAFLLSLILSPLIGLVFTLVSKSDAQAKFEKDTLDMQRKQLQMSEQKQTSSVADELTKLRALVDNGTLTQAEFDAHKARLLG